MRGLISFHPVEPAFFMEVVQPLVSGGKIDPEPYLLRALRHRVGAWSTRRYIRTLDLLLEESTPPPPPTTGSRWEKLRARLEVFDFRADPLATLVKKAIHRDLHLLGRPFLISDGSPRVVADVVERYREANSAGVVDQLVEDQLGQMSPALAGKIQPDADSEMESDGCYRAELMDALREVHDLAQAARKGETWNMGSKGPEPAATYLPGYLPWRAAWLHSRIRPFWMAENVDGLETISRAAGVTAPDCLVPAWVLFGDACDEFPKLREELHHELTGSRGIGGYVSPEDVPELVSFLKAHGGQIIQAATRAGEGPRCSVLMRKIRECATYAEKNGLGYLEALGIEPLGPDLAS
ncbi:MAG: hypothetical protein E2P00_03105 [Acidobacteria bacterium]|nr:MAG: hypothetical protein E2P00_03105 [Acidobacteriota bacterium]